MRLIFFLFCFRLIWFLLFSIYSNESSSISNLTKCNLLLVRFENDRWMNDWSIDCSWICIRKSNYSSFLIDKSSRKRKRRMKHWTWLMSRLCNDSPLNCFLTDERTKTKKKRLFSLNTYTHIYIRVYSIGAIDWREIWTTDW